MVYPVLGFSLSSGRWLPSTDLTVKPASIMYFFKRSDFPSGKLETSTIGVSIFNLDIMIFLNLPSLDCGELENLQFSLTFRTSFDFVSSFFDRCKLKLRPGDAKFLSFQLDPFKALATLEHRSWIIKLYQSTIRLLICELYPLNVSKIAKDV